VGYGAGMDTSKVTRVEVINHGAALDYVGTVDTFGRLLGTWNCSVELSLQDGDRTLKVFLDPPRPGAPATEAPSRAAAGTPAAR
jgi:hypothetical protein